MQFLLMDASDSIVHLAFTLCSKSQFSPFPMGLAAVYSSIRQNTDSRLFIHVIVDETVCAVVRNKLSSSLACGDEIFFYEASCIQESDDLSSKLNGVYSRAIIWRAWIAEYLSQLKKCILLDCDLIFNFDIKFLYQIDLSGHAISASLRVVPRAKELHEWLGVPPDKYFRLTCVVLNLEKIRADKLFSLGRKKFMSDLNIAAREGLAGGCALEQSLFNHFYFDHNTPFDIPLIPVDRIQGHPRESEWRKALQAGEPRILDMKGWESQSKYSEEFWDALSSTSWGSQVNQLRRQSDV